MLNQIKSSQLRHDSAVRLPLARPFSAVLFAVYSGLKVATKEARVARLEHGEFGMMDVLGLG